MDTSFALVRQRVWRSRSHLWSHINQGLLLRTRNAAERIPIILNRHLLLRSSHRSIAVQNRAIDPLIMRGSLLEPQIASLSPVHTFIALKTQARDSEKDKGEADQRAPMARDRTSTSSHET